MINSALFLLKVGERGTIVRISNTDDLTFRKLKTNQLTPGISLTLERLFPAFIIKVGNNRLRLNNKMMRSIYLRVF